MGRSRVLARALHQRALRFLRVRPAVVLLVVVRVAVVQLLQTVAGAHLVLLDPFLLNGLSRWVLVGNWVRGRITRMEVTEGQISRILKMRMGYDARSEVAVRLVEVLLLRFVGGL